MKRYIFKPFLFVMFLLFVSLINIQCKKEVDFCDVQRTTYKEINNQVATINFVEKYDRYAVVVTPDINDNIDSQEIGFMCGLNNEFRTSRLKVVVSGTLKKFNSNENILPEIGGQDFYFLDVFQITKK